MTDNKSIVGIETEYASHIWDDRYGRFAPEENHASDFLRVVLNAHSTFLEHGGRVYVDTGQHIETATPECASPLQAVLYDKAMEKCLAEWADDFNKIHLDPAKGKRMIFLKNNADFSGSTYGCHENYLVPAALWNALVMDISHPASRMFQLFLAVRAILCGSGSVTNDLRFVFSKRADFIKQTLGSESTGHRPMIHQRNETLMGCYASRLHILVADSNMSEWSTYLKIGSTNLVLLALQKALAKGKLSGNIFFHNLGAIRLLREVNEDIECKNVYPLKWRNSVSAPDIHRMIIDFVQKTIGWSLSPRDKEILLHWQEFVRMIESGDDDFLSRRLDWAIKKSILDRKLERAGLGDDFLMRKIIAPEDRAPVKLAHQLLALDFWYHDISPDGIYNKLAESGAVERIFSDKEVAQAKTVPPETRAAWRGRSISHLNNLRFSSAAGAMAKMEADWTNMKITSADSKRIARFDNLNPYNNNWDNVRQFIDQVAK